MTNNFSCQYIGECSTRILLPDGDSCYDKSLTEGCVTYRICKIKEEVARITSGRKRNIVGILTGNV